MDRNTQHMNYIRAHILRSRWYKVLIAAAAVVVFITTYMLILPAITLDAKCGKEEHVHSEACYTSQNQIICGQEETPGHTHTEECYRTENQLICGQEESEAVTEEIVNEETGETETVVISEGHIHDDSCYEQHSELICGQEETPGHTHTESCYQTDSSLSCGKEEHTHTDSCYHEQSNPNADVENEEIWKQTFSDVELTGNWNEDIVSIAKTQLGYKESTRNFIYDQDDEKDGYTRYGAWYGDTYGEWCAMFASFCINYAEVGEDANHVAFPLESNCANWISKLQKIDYFHDADKTLYMDQLGRETYTGDEYFVKPGDLIFFNLKNSEYVVSDHVGIITDVTEKKITTIQGNSNYSVLEKDYKPGDVTIVGFGEIPENPEYNKKEETERTESEAKKAKSTKKKNTVKKNTVTVMDANDHTDGSNDVSTANATDMTSYIKAITVKKNNNGSYQDATTFTSGETVRINMDFVIKSGIVTKEHPSVYYTFPSGLLPADVSQSGVVNDPKNNNKVGSYTITSDSAGNGVMVITYDDAFANGNEIQGSAFFDSVINITEGVKEVVYDFAGTNTRITVKEGEKVYDLQSSKKSKIGDSGKEIDYEIVLNTETGTDGEIHISDDMYEGYYHNNDVKVAEYSSQITIEKYDSSGKKLSEEIRDASGSKFEFDLPGLEAGESYKIKYRAAVNQDTLKNNGTQLVGNKVSGNLKNHPNVTFEKNTTDEVYSIKFTKSGYYDANSGLMKFTITLENPHHINMSGKSVYDTIKSSGISINSDVVVKDSQGNVVTSMQNVNGTSFNYIFPENSTSEKYTIEYTTSAPETDGASVLNKATFSDGDKNYESEAEPKVNLRSFDFKKIANGSIESNGEQNLKWKVEMNLPSGAFPNGGYLYTDTIEDAKDSNNNVIEDTHYGIKSEIDQKIRESFFMKINLNGQDRDLHWDEAKDYVDVAVTYYSKDGTVITDDNINSDVKSFTVKVTPKQTFTASSMVFEYTTNGRKTFLEDGTYFFTNDGSVDGKHSTPNTPVDITKKNTFEKKVFAGKYTGEWGQKTDWRYDTSQLPFYEYKGNGAEIPINDNRTLTYRILVNVGGTEVSNDQKIIIRDTIPSGMEYVSGSAAATAVKLKSGSTETESETASIYNQKSNANYVFNEHLTANYSGNQLELVLDKGYLADGIQRNDFNQGYYAIYYQLKITDPAWDNEGTVKRSYVNNASWVGKDSNVSQETKVVRPFKKVTKEADTEKDSDGHVRAINYKVFINLTAADVDPYSEILTLTDQLNPGVGKASIRLESVKLCEYSETADGNIGKEVNLNRYQYKYDNNSKLLTVNLPDELACVLTYTYDIDASNVASDEFTVENTANLKGSEGDNNKTTVEKWSSGVVSQQSTVTIHKVDKNNYRKQLEKVAFNLQYLDEDGSWKDNGTYQTDKNGLIIFDHEAQSKSEHYYLRQNILYKLVETKTNNPGYTPDSTPYYMVWLDSSMDGSQWYYSKPHDSLQYSDIHYISSDGANIYIENEYNLVSVHKVWVDADGADIQNPTGSVTVELHKMSGKKIIFGGREYLIPDNSTVTITSPVLSTNENDTSPIQLNGVNDVTAIRSKYVGGTANNQWIDTYTISGSSFTDGSTISINNNYQADGYRMTYVLNSDENDTLIDTVDLNKSTDWSYSWDNLESGAMYSVFETKINGKAVESTAYDVSYLNNGIHTGEITIVNKAPREEHETVPTSLTLQKKWVDQDGTELNADDFKEKPVKFRLMQVIEGNEPEYATEYTTVTLPDKDGNWSVTVSDIPKTEYSSAGKTTNYKYYFEEVTDTSTEPTYQKDSIWNFLPFYNGKEDPKDVLVDEGTVIVTNKVKPTNTEISVEKQWKNADGSTFTEEQLRELSNVNISVDLYQLKDEEEQGTKINTDPIILNSSNQWSYSKDNLIKEEYKDGKKVSYRYYFIETEVSGYKTTYKTESSEEVTTASEFPINSGTFTVINTKQLKDEVTVTKQWFKKTADGSETSIDHAGSINFNIYRVATEKESTCDHSWSEWHVTKAATEDTKGEETRTCSICKITETREIGTLEHQHTYTSKVTKKATCSEEGTITYTCIKGDYTYTEKIDKLKHTPSSDRVNVKAATETEKGYTGDIVCIVCGTTIEQGEDIDPVVSGGTELVTVSVSTKSWGSTWATFNDIPKNSHIVIKGLFTGGNWLTLTANSSIDNSPLEVTKSETASGYLYTIPVFVTQAMNVDISWGSSDQFTWTYEVIEDNSASSSLTRKMIKSSSRPKLYSTKNSVQSPNIPSGAEFLGTYQLHKSNNWSWNGSFDAELGYTYQYYVEEVGTSDNWTVTYEGQGSNNLTIKNTVVENPVELPHTGGRGTKLITMLGILLMAAASSLMILKKHRKEESW